MNNNKSFSIRDLLPNYLYARLWGDRQRWGPIPQETDADWLEWRRISAQAYKITQRNYVGTKLLNAGYGVMSKIDLAEKTILEIGPGDIEHTKFWQNLPKEYILVDINADMLNIAEDKLKALKIPSSSLLIAKDKLVPLEDSSIDAIVSFNSLEHLYPLESYLKEFYRLLRPGGYLIGAIPAEGGLAWGLGRMLTTRRWFKKNTSVNLDKIICWEHPNFADEIIQRLNLHFRRKKLSFWPMKLIPILDINLVVSFIYSKKQ